MTPITAFPDFRLGLVRFELKPNEDLHICFSREALKKSGYVFLDYFGWGLISNFAWEAIKLIKDPAKSLYDLFSKTVFKTAMRAGAIFGFGAASKFLAEDTGEKYVKNERIKTTWNRTFIDNNRESEINIIDKFLEDRDFISEEKRQEVTCPMTQTFMLSPTELDCNPGHIFEAIAVKDWSERSPHSTCPLCRRVVNLTNKKHSEITLMKSCFVVQKIYNRLRAFNAPEGVNIMQAREVIQVLGYKINERNNCIYEHSLNYISRQRYQAPQLQAIHADLLAWKNAVDIRMEG